MRMLMSACFNLLSFLTPASFPAAVYSRRPRRDPPRFTLLPGVFTFLSPAPNTVDDDDDACTLLVGRVSVQQRDSWPCSMRWEREGGD